MVDDIAKAHLHGKLRAVREALVWKLDGVSEYDVRRPLTSTGTNLLGLVKHNAISDARYFGWSSALPSGCGGDSGRHVTSGVANRPEIAGPTHGRRGYVWLVQSKS